MEVKGSSENIAASWAKPCNDSLSRSENNAHAEKEQSAWYASMVSEDSFSI